MEEANPGANALFGLVISPEQEGGARLLIPLRGIRSIGKDAITVEGLNVAELFDDNVQAQEISVAGGYRSGMDVMTESGESVGKVDKVTLKETGPSGPITNDGLLRLEARDRAFGSEVWLKGHAHHLR